MMAEAYGGEAKPVPLKAPIRTITSARSKHGLSHVREGSRLKS